MDPKVKKKIRKFHIENHKCYGCTWGKWTGLKYYCPFLKCVKGRM